jgi:nucleolar protein 16
MVKHGATKKRRSGRKGKTKLKNRNHQFYKPASIQDATARAIWNFRKSPSQNMAEMGLQACVNNSIDKRAASAKEQWKEPVAKPDGNIAIELFDIPQTNNTNGITKLPGKTFAQTLLPVSIEDQKYIRKCLAKHGDDYKRMMRDIKTNNMQHTESKLKNMAEKFYQLTNDQVKVEVPEKVKHLMVNYAEEEDASSSEQE